MKLLKWDNEDAFYYIQILRRKKENPDARSVKVIDNLYAHNKEYLWDKKKYVEEMCEYFNARAYIRLNRRSWRNVSLLSLEMLAKRIRSEQYQLTNSVFFKACGNTHIEDPRLWVIDIDNPMSGYTPAFINQVCVSISKLQLDITKNHKIIDTIQTPNGWHIITNPFNTKVFSEIYPTIDIHKDNPTILFSP